MVITEVLDDSPAAARGLESGMVITDLNHKPVKSLADYNKLLAAANLKQGVLLNYVDTAGNSQFQVLKED